MTLRQRPSPNASRNRRIPAASAPSEPIHATLRDLRPLWVDIVAPGSDDAQMFDDLLAHEHYLGHRTTVGDLPAALRRRQGTSATSYGISRDERWHVSCLARPACAFRLSASVLAQAGTQTGGVEVCRSRCIYRLGSNGTRAQPAAYNQQHSISHSVLGSGSAFLPAPHALAR